MSLLRIKEIAASTFDTIRNIFAFRHILFQLVVREIKGRFVGSIGGLLWHFINPILTLIIYLFVFVYVFKLRVGTSGGAGASAVYIMAGLFPWMIIAEGLLRGTSSMIENAALIQKTYFPTEILAAKAVVAPFLSYGVAILLFTIYICLSHGFLMLVFILPFILMLQLFFTLGVSLLSATLSVFFRDVMQLMNIIITFWIYVTPILYPASMLPEWAKNFMYVNPLYPFMSIYQSLFLSGTLGNWHMLLLAALWSAAFFVTGAFVFNKLKYEFADWL